MAKIRKIYDDAIKPDGSKQVIYPVTSTRAVYTTSNVTLDKMLSEGYRFGGIVLPTDSPSITDQRVFYGASVPGVYTSFGNIAVDSGEAIFLLYDGEHWEKGIFGGAGYSTLTGFKALASIQDLPREETQFGYLINGHLYVWVGENGDTLDGLYLDCGELRGASAYEVAVRNGYRGTEQEWLNDPVHGIKGISVKSVECIHEALEDGGTNIWRITLTNGNATDFEVKNGNQGNSGYQGAAGELEVVNNLTDGGATAALSAEMGKAIVDLYGSYVENPEFVKVWLDKEERILMAIRSDGDVYFGAGCPPQVKDYVEERIASLGLQDYKKLVAFVGDLINSPKTLSELLNEKADAAEVAEQMATKANASDVNEALNTKVDKEEGKSLIPEQYIQEVDSPEFVDVKLDIDEKIIEGTRKDGSKFIGGDLTVQGRIDNPEIHEEIDTAIEEMKAEVQQMVEESKEKLSYFDSIDNPEYLQVTTDSESKVLKGIKPDGTSYIGGDLQVEGDIKTPMVDIEVTEDPEWLQVTTDKDNKILEGVTRKGERYIANLKNPVLDKVPVLDQRVTYIEDKLNDEGIVILEAFSDGDYRDDTETTFYGKDPNHLNAIQRAVNTTIDDGTKYLIKCHGVFTAYEFEDFCGILTSLNGHIYYNVITTPGHPNITFRGDGKDETYIIGDLSSKTPGSYTIEDYATVYPHSDNIVFEDMTIYGKGVKYPVHIEGSGTKTNWGIYNTDNTTQTFNRVRLFAEPPSYGTAAGIGIAPGETIIFNDCELINEATWGSYFHDGRGRIYESNKSPRTEYNRCLLMSTGNMAMCAQLSCAGVPNYAIYNNCTFACGSNNLRIDQGYPMGINFDYRKGTRLILEGVGNSPAKFYPYNRFLKCLKITSINEESIVTFDKNCSAFDVLIKGIDIKNKTTADGLIYEDSYLRRVGWAMGLRTLSLTEYESDSSFIKTLLGDRSSEPITLTVYIDSNQIDITFNADYSNITDSQFLDIVNAALNGSAIASYSSECIEDYVNFKDGCVLRKNTTNTFIKKGSLVAISGRGVKKAAGENTYGIALQSIPSGQHGKILIKGIVGLLSNEYWGIDLQTVTKDSYYTTDSSGNIITTNFSNIVAIDNNNVLIK